MKRSFFAGGHGGGVDQIHNHETFLHGHFSLVGTSQRKRVRRPWRRSDPPPQDRLHIALLDLAVLVPIGIHDFLSGREEESIVVARRRSNWLIAQLPAASSTTSGSVAPTDDFGFSYFPKPTFSERHRFDGRRNYSHRTTWDDGRCF
jgi:hypothetical protein